MSAARKKPRIKFDLIGNLIDNSVEKQLRKLDQKLEMLDESKPVDNLHFMVFAN